MRKFSIFLMSLLFSCASVFAAEGDVVWTRTYNGDPGESDVAYAIAVDEEANVYVAGYITKSSQKDIWVGKYTSGGELVWIDTHDSLVSPGADDEAHGIAVDQDGYVYVCGFEDGGVQGSNMWIRKYTPYCDIVWTKTFDAFSQDDSVNRISVDKEGNIYAIGYLTNVGQKDIVLGKLDSDGNGVWQKTYSGPSGGDDEGLGIAVDEDGNVYAVGKEYVTGEGTNIWVRKYDSGGNLLWAKTHSGSAIANDEGGYGVAIDKDGNVYVCGVERVTGEGQNVWLRKYTSKGEVLWTRTYNGPADPSVSYDGGMGVAVDSDGDVYVVGYRSVSEPVNNLEIWLRKYSSDGDVLWTKTYEGEAPSERMGAYIALDTLRNIYICGVDLDTSDSSACIWVRKYAGQFGQHFAPPEEGQVKVQGGKNGYVNPNKGELARIHFRSEKSGVVKVKIYTLRGLLVWEGSKNTSGSWDYINWNCRNKEGDLVASGIYVVDVEGAGIKEKKKVAVMK